MEDIAKAAGIGKATLYYYFKSKEDVFAAMTERAGKAAVQTITEAAQAGETPQARLRIFGNTLAEIIKEKIDYYAAFHEEIIEIFPSVAKKQLSVEKRGLVTLQHILQEGVEQHVFNISNVEATAELVMTLMQGLTERILIEERRATWKKDMQRFLDLILQGLEVRGKENGI
jgi:AcrR family transcriptional regulator